MFKKIKEFFVKIKQTKEEKKKMDDAKKYYEILQSGGLFLKYIYQDLENNKNQLNRDARRRMEKSLQQKGQFSEEIIKHYQSRIDNVLIYIELQKQKGNKNV